MTRAMFTRIAAFTSSSTFATVMPVSSKLDTKLIINSSVGLELGLALGEKLGLVEGL